MDRKKSSKLPGLLLALVLLLGLWSVTALAEAESVQVTASAGSGGGRIQINDREPAETDTVYVERGTPVTIRAIPEEGYRLVYWDDDTYAAGDPGSLERTVSPTSSHTYIAHFYSRSAELSVTMDDVDLGVANEGYSVGTWGNYLIQGDIRLHRTGQVPLAPAAAPIKLDEEAQKYFTAVRTNMTYSGAVVSASRPYFYWAIIPKEGLGPGTYSGTFTLVERCEPALDPPITATVRFEVTDDPVINTAGSPSSGGAVEGGGRYAPGETVTLTAVPKEHYRFTRWSDGSTENPYSFPAEESKTLTAYFEQYEFLVNVRTDGNGKVQIGDGEPVTSESFYVDRGTNLLLRAIPEEGYRLVYWDDDVYAVGDPGSLERTVNPSSSVTYTAHFCSRSAELSVTMDDVDLGVANEGYSVGTWGNYLIQGDIRLHRTGQAPLAPAAAPIKLDEEAKQYFTAVRTNMTYSGAVISASLPYFYWAIIPKEGLGVGTYSGTFTLVERCEPALDPPITARVTFTVTPKYILETEVSPAEAGTVEGAGEYGAGDPVTLTASPIETYRFDHWERGGAEISAENPYTFDADRSGTVKAVFVRTSARISLAANDDRFGSVRFSGTEGSSALFERGASVTALASPEDGYAFDYWTDNGNRTSDGASITVSAITEHELVAHFKPFEYTVRVNAGENGGAFASASSAPAGTVITVTAVPAPGCRLGAITYTPQGGTATDITGTGRFSMPEGNVTVDVTFERPITVSGGVVSPGRLTYSLENAPEGAVLAAARYRDGQLTDLQLIRPAQESGTILLGGSGEVYRLFILDGGWLPLSEAWGG